MIRCLARFRRPVPAAESLISFKDLVLCINTTYLACIVLVVLLIYTLSVNPSPSSVHLISASLWTTGTHLCSDWGRLCNAGCTREAGSLVLNPDCTCRSLMIHFPNSDKTGWITVSCELPSTCSLSESLMYRIMDPENWTAIAALVTGGDWSTFGATNRAASWRQGAIIQRFYNG